jgi:hypothetical protein
MILNQDVIQITLMARFDRGSLGRKESLIEVEIE